MVENKRLILFLMVTMSIVLVTINPLSAAPNSQTVGQVDLRFDPASVEGKAGNQVVVEVIAGNAAPVAGLQFEVIYDSTVARAISVEPGTLPPGTFFQGNANSGTSPISVAVASALPFGESNSTVTLAKITFNLVGASGTMTDLVLDQVLVSSAEIRPLPFTTSRGEITVSAGTVAHQPSLALHQDPLGGTTGVKIDVLWLGNPAENVLLGSFQVQLAYDGSCLNILGVRGTDFTVSEVSIDNDSGVATFIGSSSEGILAPANLGHALTRLVDSALRPCALTMDLVELKGVANGTIAAVPGSLTLDLLRGDALADGAVTIADARLVAQYLVGSRPPCTTTVDITCLHSVNAASVRHDGGFDEKTIADALFIAQFRVGSRDESFNLVPSPAFVSELGQQIRLEVGDTAILESENLELTFLEVSEDSRCPSDVLCVWEGQATVVVNLSARGQKPGSIDLTLRAGHEELATQHAGRYRLTLAGLEPYPVDARQIQPQEYRATLVVSTAE